MLRDACADDRHDVVVVVVVVGHCDYCELRCSRPVLYLAGAFPFASLASHHCVRSSSAARVSRGLFMRTKISSTGLSLSKRKSLTRRA